MTTNRGRDGANGTLSEPPVWHRPPQRVPHGHRRPRGTAASLRFGTPSDRTSSSGTLPPQAGGGHRRPRSSGVNPVHHQSSKSCQSTATAAQFVRCAVDGLPGTSGHCPRWPSRRRSRSARPFTSHPRTTTTSSATRAAQPATASSMEPLRPMGLGTRG